TRDVDCAKFTSSGNRGNKSLHIVTTEGRSLSVVAIGSASSPQNINFKYGKGCYIDLLRDVKSIERVNDHVQKVVLQNGKVIEIGTYDSELWGGKFTVTPYNKSLWPILVAAKNGGIEYYSEQIDPFRNLAKLSVLDQPVNQSYLKALADLKLKEDAGYKAERKPQTIKREEEKRKAERERLEQKAELARSERQKKDGAGRTISKEDNIGRKICRKGMLKYSAGNATVGEPGAELHAFLEGFSRDGYRIKFRVLGWATQTGRLKFNPSSPMMFEGFTVEPGTIYWDDVKEWFLCD
ncbi:MAG: hypothetical protein WC450_11070, partial [Candidatus Omnitrophota bacterium]